MSPGNRQDPDLTNANGGFGWDVLAGYYEVRAEKPGCSDPDDPSQSYVLSQAVYVPPEVKGLRLVLSCPGDAPASGTGPTPTGTGASPAPASTASAPATQPAPPSGPAGSAELRIAPRITVTTAGLAAVGVRCSGTGGSVCTGRLVVTRTVLQPALRRVGGQLRRLQVKRAIRLGSVAYRLRAGSSTMLRLRVSRALLVLLRAAGHQGIAVTVSVPGANGRPVTRTARMLALAPARKPLRI
jgi:hypothetical protein